MTEDDVRDAVLDMLEFSTQAKVAEVLGVSVQYLNDYLHFRRAPGPKLLEGLGFRRVISYERTSEPPNVRANRPEEAEGRNGSG